MEKARTYMDNTVGDRVSSEFKEAYLVNAPKMIDWLRENTKVKFLYVPGYSDYHPERSGEAQRQSLVVDTFLRESAF